MMALAALLVAAAAGHGISHLFRIPAIPMLVLSGLALSFVGVVPPQFLEDALIVGLTFLVFLAGLELNPQRVGRQRRAALQVGLVQFLVLGGAGFAAGITLGFQIQTSLYLALALSASSTLVVVRTLQRRRQLFEPFGRMVLGVLLLQDLLIVCLIPVAVLFPQGARAVGIGLLGTLGMGLLTGVVLRWVAPFLIRSVREDGETLLLAVLALLFGFLGIAQLAGLPLVVGAFFAGVSVSGFPVNGLVRGQLAPVSDFFSALFFTALGASLVLPSVQVLAQGAGLSLLVVLITPPVVAFMAERAGFSARPGIFSGFLLAQTSEFSLVVGLQGMVAGHITPDVFTVIVLVTLITMTLTPFLASDRLTWRLLDYHPGRRPPDLDPPPRDHVVLIGAGSNGQALLEELALGGREVVVVEDDPAIIDFLEESGFRTVRGDATDFEVLRKAGVEEAHLVVSTVPRPEDIGPLLDKGRQIPIVARVFNVEDAEWVKERGGEPVLFSDAAADDFLEWYDAGCPPQELE
ncbi:MAG: cation:proton antiporter [Gemmatimonadota bacterium]